MRTQVAVLAYILSMLAGCGDHSTTDPTGSKQLHAQKAEHRLVASVATTVPYGGTGLDTPPKIAHSGQVLYPSEARSAGIAGTVRIKFEVNEDGIVSAAWVLQSPHELLSAAATSAIRQWRFEPMTIAGKRTTVILFQDIAFTLGGQFTVEPVEMK